MKKIIKIILVFVLSLCMFSFSFAKEVSVSEKELIVASINKFFDAVKNLDIESAIEVTGYKLADNSQMGYMKEFFTSYPEAETQCKEIFSKLTCKVGDVELIEGSTNKYTCKLKISYPDITMLVKKARTSIIFNNFADFISGNITNKNVASIINSIYKEFKKNNYDTTTNNISITLKKQGDKFIVYDLNELISRIQKYISEYGSSIMK